MAEVNNRKTFICPKCKKDVEIYIRPIIDPLNSPDDYIAFIQNKLNPSNCSCGLKLDIPTPTIINEKYWVGVALENPRPITAVNAFDIIEKINPDNSGKPIVVVGKCDELRHIISESSDPFCSIRMDLLCFRNFAQFIEILTAIGDAYCDRDRPDAAYWMFREVITVFIELYFNPLFNKQLEFLSLAAGDRISDGLKEKRTAEQDLQIIKAKLDSQRIIYPKWWESTYFCFYEHNPHTNFNITSHLWNVIVDNVTLNNGRIDFTHSEKHQVVCPVQAVYQDEPDDKEKAIMYMLMMMMMSEAERKLQNIPNDIKAASKFCGAELLLKWDTINFREKQEIETIYAVMTNGLDFRQEFGL